MTLTKSRLTFAKSKRSQLWEGPSSGAIGLASTVGPPPSASSTPHPAFWDSQWYSIDFSPGSPYAVFDNSFTPFPPSSVLVIGVLQYNPNFTRADLTISDTQGNTYDLIGQQDKVPFSGGVTTNYSIYAWLGQVDKTLPNTISVAASDDTHILAFHSFVLSLQTGAIVGDGPTFIDAESQPPIQFSPLTGVNAVGNNLYVVLGVGDSADEGILTDCGTPSDGFTGGIIADRNTGTTNIYVVAATAILGNDTDIFQEDRGVTSTLGNPALLFSVCISGT